MAKGTKTVINFTKDTPQWAKNVFRIVMYLNAGVSAWVASSNLFTPETKYEVVLILNVLVTPLVHAISKIFGVSTYEKPDTDYPNKR